MVTLDGMREFGYADDLTFQPKVAVKCINAAKEYFANAGVFERESELYDQSIYILAMYLYDNREGETVGQVRREIALDMSNVIHQLRYTPIGADKGYRPLEL